MSDNIEKENIQKDLIERYKNLIREDNNEKELYKWRLIKGFQEKWDIDAGNFPEMAQSIDFANLHYYMSRTFIEHADEYPEEARSLFRMLYDETLSLKQRIDEFSQGHLVFAGVCLL